MIQNTNSCMRHQRIVLDNGLVVVLQKSAEQHVGVVLCTKSGSLDDPVGMSGANHFLEHMLWRQVYEEKYASLRQDMARRGYDCDAETFLKHQTLEWDIHEDFLLAVLQVMQDAGERTFWEEDVFEREKGVVVQEVLQGRDKPVTRCTELFDQLMWNGTVYTVEEEVGQLVRIKSADLLHMRHKEFVPNNMILGVYGTFDTKKAIRDIEHTLGSLEAKALPAKKEYSPKPPMQCIVRDDVCLAYSVLGRCCSGMAAEIVPQLEVVAELLYNDGIKSRLFEKLRLKKGISYSLSTDVAIVDENKAVFYVTNHGVMPHMIRAVEEILFQELDAITKHPVPKYELDHVKKLLLSEEESCLDRCERLVLHELCGIPLQNEYARVIKHMTSEDVSCFVRKELLKSYTTATLLPQGGVC